MKLKCPVTRCPYEVEVPEKPQEYLLEYIEIYADFREHLLTKHTPSEVIEGIFRLLVHWK